MSRTEPVLVKTRSYEMAGLRFELQKKNTKRKLRFVLLT
jgi:hypothetical protein